jgi:hypothetical protein
VPPSGRAGESNVGVVEREPNFDAVVVQIHKGPEIRNDTAAVEQAGAVEGEIIIVPEASATPQ